MEENKIKPSPSSSILTTKVYRIQSFKPNTTDKTYSICSLNLRPNTTVKACNVYLLNCQDR